MVDVPKIKIQEITTDPAPALAGIAVPHTRGGQTWKVGGEKLAELVHQKFPAFYITKNYSDNGTDDDVRFAVDAAYNAGGGEVYDPRQGERLINNPIILPDGVTLKGAGKNVTIYKAKAGLNDDVIKTDGVDALWSGDSADGPQYFGVERLTINGNKAQNSAGSGIKAYGRSFIIRDVSVIYCKEKGIATRWGATQPAWNDSDEYLNDPFMEPLLDNVWAGYNDEDGIWYDGAHDGRIVNCIAGLNSHTVAGSYDGIYIGARAGGMMATQCHSWGPTQRYAYNVEAWGGHYGNNQADNAYEALVRINAPDVTWIGAHQHGGFIETPPSPKNKNLKGFVFGPDCVRPFIIASLRNCPKGLVDFTNLPTTKGGLIHLYGALDDELLHGATGESTYGWQGTIPSNFDLNVRAFGAVQNNYAVRQANSEMFFIAGTASWPSQSCGSDPDTGAYFPGADQWAVATGGTRRLNVSADGVFAGASPNSDPAFNGVAGALMRNDGRLSVGSPSNSPAAALSRRGTDGTVVTFLKDTTTVGTISVNTTNTAYNTSSDGRKKEDLRPIDHELLNAVQVYDFLWRGSEERGMGVVAQELEAIAELAHLVHTDENGEKGVDYSKFVPLLIAKIKHLESLIKS